MMPFAQKNPPTLHRIHVDITPFSILFLFSLGFKKNTLKYLKHRREGRLCKYQFKKFYFLFFKLSLEKSAFRKRTMETVQATF